MKTQILMVIGYCILGIGTSAQIIHVPGDKSTIQEAINGSTDGDTILVAEDTYYENINFKGKAIMLASHFILDGNQSHIENTIIDGSQFANPDSASVVTFCSGEDTTSIIIGFTIQGGEGTYNNYWSETMCGGGIYLWNSGAKIVSNFIISNHLNNPVRNCGGAGIGSCMDSGNYWVIIDGNLISNNSCTANAEYSFGGGIYTTLNAIIRNNIIEQNSCYNSAYQAEGGGIEVEQLPGTTINTLIDNNIVQDNSLQCDKTWGGGIIIYYAGAIISNNIIQDNKNQTEEHSWGAGLMCAFNTDQVIVHNNLFSENTGPIDPDAVGAGGGMAIRDGYEEKIIVDGNIFMKNESKHGAGFLERNSYNLQLINNVFIENVSHIGGGIGMYQPQANPGVYRPQISNNTFFGNHANATGGAIRLTGDGGDEVISFNNLFWENDALENGNDIYNNTLNDTIFIIHSNLDTTEIFGSWTGFGNINVDPLFIDSLGHLNNCSSLCINAGISEIEVNWVIYFAPLNDFEGDERPYLNTLPDIGADETPCLEVIASIDYNEAAFQTDGMNVYPNPFFSKTSIEINLTQVSFIKLQIIDYTGKKIEILESENLPTGNHTIELNSNRLPPGIYLCVLKTNAGIQTKKIIKL